MLELVAQGDGSDTQLLQAAAERTAGSGVIEFELDTEFDPLGRFGPALKIGAAISAAIPALELTLKAIPGVHLDQGIQWIQHDGHGTLRIVVRNNPAPLVLAPAVAAVLPWLLKFGAILIGFIISWKLVSGDVKGGGSVIILVILVVAAVLLFVFAKGGKGFKPPSLGG